MADEEESSGIGTVIGVVVLLIALVTLGWLFASKSGEVTKLADKFFPDSEELGEIKKIQEDVFEGEEIMMKKEEEAAEAILAVFERLSRSKDDECIMDFTFDKIEDKDFKIKVDGKRVEVLKKDGLRVYRNEEPYKKKFFFMKSRVIKTEKGNILERGVKAEELFFITDELSKINNEFVLGKWIYVEKDSVYFLDSDTSFEYSGLLGFEKRKCKIN